MDSWLLVVVAALAASTLAAIAGTGGGVILLPVLVSVFGVRDAVPMYAIAHLAGNLSRIYLNRAEIEFPVAGWFCLGAVPFAVLGSWLFTRIPDAGLLRVLGAFLVISVLARRLAGERFRIRHRAWFAPVGGAFATISGIVGSAGPFLAPFFLSYGMMKGAFIGTEALGTAVMHLVKLASYHGLGVMTSPVWLAGLMLGPVMIAGSVAGKQAMHRIPAHAFTALVDLVVLGFGAWFLFTPDGAA
jgi:uncharacterized protein